MTRSEQGSPAEETIRVVPFLGQVEIDAVEPTRFGLDINRTADVVDQGRGDIGAHIPEQPADQERKPSGGAFEVHLLVAVELPRYQLTEDDIVLFRFRYDSVADDPGAGLDQGDGARITVVDIGAADSGPP